MRWEVESARQLKLTKPVLWVETDRWHKWQPRAEPPDGMRALLKSYDISALDGLSVAKPIMVPRRWLMVFASRNPSYICFGAGYWWKGRRV
jgi:hypothetical protein